MKSRLLRTFGLVLITMSFLASGLKANNPVFLGYGSDPQWSPSGKLIGAWRGDTLIVFDVQTCKELKSIPVHRPKFCYWISEDTLALSYQSRTEAERPRDRWPIVTRSIVTLDGNYTEILSDTIVDSRNSLSHWRQLPNGKVGLFRIVNDVRTAFLQLVGGKLQAVSADTVSREQCWQKSPSLVEAWFPSANCSLSLAYSNEKRLVVLANDGSVLKDIGPRSELRDGGKFMIADRPFWSYDSRFLSFTEFVEDERMVLSTSIVVVSLSDFNRTVVQTSYVNQILTASWSPSNTVLLLMAEGRLQTWQPGQ